MKMILTATLALFSSAAFAADPVFPPQAVAEIVKYSVVKGSTNTTIVLSLRVSKNGSVDYYLNGIYAAHIATLALPRVTALKAASDRLKAEELTFNGEDSGACNNPTTTLYRVARTKAEPVTLVKIENCRKLRMAGHADRELKHILQGLEALADLQ